METTATHLHEVLHGLVNAGGSTNSKGGAVGQHGSPGGTLMMGSPLGMQRGAVADVCGALSTSAMAAALQLAACCDHGVCVCVCVYWLWFITNATHIPSLSQVKGPMRSRVTCGPPLPVTSTTMPNISMARTPLLRYTSSPSRRLSNSKDQSTWSQLCMQPQHSWQLC